MRASIDEDIFKRKVGFFVGGYAAIDISEKFQFQPELLIALQGTRVFIKDIEIRPDPSILPIISDFESNINELTISIPLVVRYFIIDTFFLEGGAQLAYVINRSENIKKNPFEEYSDGMVNSTQFNYDKFDMGFAVGTGYKFSEKISLVGRFYMGLIERDNSIKSSIFNLGIEYSL